MQRVEPGLRQRVLQLALLDAVQLVARVEERILLVRTGAAAAVHRVTPLAATGAMTSAKCSTAASTAASSMW